MGYELRVTFMVGEAISPSVARTEAGKSDQWLTDSLRAFPLPYCHRLLPILHCVECSLRVPKREKFSFHFMVAPDKQMNTGIETEATTDYVAV